MTAIVPTISVEFDMESERFHLLASSYGQVMPVGPRLFRAAPYPHIAFEHQTQDAAEKDAATLRAYLDDCAAGRRKEKESKPVGRGWWED